MYKRLLSVLTVCATLGAAATIPRPAPELAIQMNNGTKTLLSNYRGKAVVLSFILTTCPHCQKTTGILSKLQKEMGPRGVQMLGSAIEDMAAMAVPGFIRDFQPAYPVGYNTRDQALAFLQHPAMFRLMMPQLVFIDKQGTIKAQFSGDDNFFAGDQEKNIRDQIEALLKEGAAPKKVSAVKSHKKSS